MTRGESLKVALALLATTALAAGCAAVGADATAPVQGTGNVPQPDIWVAYQPGGVGSTKTPVGKDIVVSVGSYRSPIISLRIPSIGSNAKVEADLLTPAEGVFDERARARHSDQERWESSGEREEARERALTHHRPAVRFGVGPQDRVRTRSSPQVARHERCARRLVRAMMTEQMADAENRSQRQTWRRRLRDENITRLVSAPVGNAALLLRMAVLSLPETSEHQAVREVSEEFTELEGQYVWRAQQISAHGRHVRLELDLLTAGNTPAARVCRSLAYEERWTLRKDRCTISGVVDRRDGWPIMIVATRDAEAENKATESVSRSFRRLTPLEGFVPPANPCPAGG